MLKLSNFHHYVTPELNDRCVESSAIDVRCDMDDSDCFSCSSLMEDEENSDVDMSSLEEIDDRELLFASKSE